MRVKRMKNDNFKEIAQQFQNAKSVLLFPHKNMDGDAMGSCVALCIALRKMDRECYIIVEDGVPDFLKFLDCGYCTDNGCVISEPDICACIDCGELSRFEKNKDFYLKGKTKICIDHHMTSLGNEPIADYNYIVPDAAATGELIYMLLTGDMTGDDYEGLVARLDVEMAEAIFAAITTDTGNFQYSNTTKRSHEIVGKLYDVGIDANKVSIELYENISLQKLKITSKILSELEIFADGRAVIAYVTQDMLSKSSVKLEETEGIVATLRSIAGVEIAAFLKEYSDGMIKVSMRAKREGNVAVIGAKYGGGGHVKAAGCTLDYSMEKSIILIKSEIEAVLAREYR